MVGRVSPASPAAMGAHDVTVSRICLLTPWPLAANPRLVKEADALAEVGHDVVAIASRGNAWVETNDASLRAHRTWSVLTVGGQPDSDGLRYLATRLRHGPSRRLLGRPGGRLVPPIWALSRVAPSLRRAARRERADLYIAHYPGALPAAVAAARHHGTAVAYDVEDLYSRESSPTTAAHRLVEQVERDLVPTCSYVSASSPGIADAYATLFGITRPDVLLNVFPLSLRPSSPTPASADGPLTLYWYSQVIGPDRGLEDAIRAMSHLLDLPVILTLRGSWHPGYRDAMDRLACAAGVPAERIRVHPPAPADAMVRLAATHHIGLAIEHPDSPNRDLCLTNKLFTYILAGNAVAGTATVGQAPVLELLGDAAMSYQPGDAAGLAAGIRRWATDRPALVRARQSAWDWGTRRYNWDLEKQKFLALVAKALGS